MASREQEVARLREALARTGAEATRLRAEALNAQGRAIAESARADEVSLQATRRVGEAVHLVQGQAETALHVREAELLAALRLEQTRANARLQEEVSALRTSSAETVGNVERAFEARLRSETAWAMTFRAETARSAQEEEVAAAAKLRAGLESERLQLIQHAEHLRALPTGGR